MEYINNIVQTVFGIVAGKVSDLLGGVLYEASAAPRSGARVEDPNNPVGLWEGKIRRAEESEVWLLTAQAQTGKGLYLAQVRAAAAFLRSGKTGLGEDLPTGKVPAEIETRALVIFRQVLADFQMTEEQYIGHCEAFILAAGAPPAPNSVNVILDPSAPQKFICRVKLTDKENIASMVSMFPDVVALFGEIQTPWSEYYQTVLDREQAQEDAKITKRETARAARYTKLLDKMGFAVTPKASAK